MTIRLPHSKPSNGRTSEPKARRARTRKPARLREFLAVKGGKPFPPHFPPRVGALPREPRPVLAPRVIEMGPFPPLGIPLDIAEVARMIGCSPWTVRQTLIPRGLPHFRFKASGRLTFYRDQVVRWIESQQQGGTTTK